MTAVLDTLNNGGLWVQPGGPNNPVYFVGCADLGDIVAKRGATTLLQCINKNGGWDTVGATKKPDDVVTTSIENLTYGARGWLDRLNCSFSLFAMQRECGEADIFNNYVRAIILNNATVVSQADKNIVARTDDKESTQSRDIEAWPPVIRTGTLTARRQTTSETKDLNAIWTFTPVNCAIACPTAGDNAVTGSDSSVYDVDVLRTTNGGVTWTATAADPFLHGENILSIVAFPISSTVNRILVAEAAPVAARGRLAYSDDNGATWTEVLLPINTHGAKGPDALWAIDQSHIWLASAKGYIYFSSDGGATWTAQTAGTLTVKDVYAVKFSDANNGMASCATDVILYTTDGGATWALTPTVTGTGADLLTVGVAPSGSLWWIGTSTGRMFYSSDKGTTWAERTGGSFGSGSINDIEWANAMVGYAIQNTAAPVGSVLVTINGGYSWSAITLSGTNAGLNCLAVADENTVYAVGNAYGGTAMIIKITWG